MDIPPNRDYSTYNQQEDVAFTRKSHLALLVQLHEAFVEPSMVLRSGAWPRPSKEQLQVVCSKLQAGS